MHPGISTNLINNNSNCNDEKQKAGKNLPAFQFMIYI